MLLNRSIMRVILVLFLFCAIFTPDFFPFSMRYLVVAICIIGIGWRWLCTGMVSIDDRFLSIFKCFVPFLIWLPINQVIHIVTDYSNATIYLYTFEHTFEIFIAAFFMGLFLIYVCEDNNFDINDVIKILVAVAVLQFVCVLLAFFFPEIRMFFISLTIKNSYSDRLVELAEALCYRKNDRAYGLSNNLFDSFGYITSVLISIIFIWGMEKNNSKIRLLSLLMIFMPLVNARSGVLFSIIAILVASFFYLDYRTISKNIGIAILGIAAFISIINELPETMVEWIFGGLQEILDLTNADSSNAGTFGKLLGTDLVLPSNILFGDGGLPLKLISYGVDNGYINVLWNFGIVGAILLFYGYFRMLKLSYLATNIRMNKVLSVVLGILFFLYLFKVYSLDLFGGIVLFFGGISLIIVKGNACNIKLQ